MQKVAIIGDSFVDKYVFGKVNRISPEAPIPILDVERKEIRGGGAINVANNLYAIGVEPILYTITNLKLPYKVISPKKCKPIIKTRYIGNNYQLIRVDSAIKYNNKDLVEFNKLIKNIDVDIIVAIDYNKGTIKGGRYSIVDTKKKDLSVFRGTEILKINKNEYIQAINTDHFSKAFITKDKDGINYYENEKLVIDSPARPKEIIDITGAGDTVMAVIIYCLVMGISEPKKIMELANKAAGIVISKFGTSIINYNELFK